MISGWKYISLPGACTFMYNSLNMCSIHRKEAHMPYGYAGRVLDINLTTNEVRTEDPGEMFYRTYMGGSGLGLAYLLKYLPAHVDPLGPDNILVISVGVLTGAPISGLSRVMANAKSPLTGAIGDGQGG